MRSLPSVSVLAASFVCSPSPRDSRLIRLVPKHRFESICENSPPTPSPPILTHTPLISPSLSVRVCIYRVLDYILVKGLGAGAHRWFGWVGVAWRDERGKVKEIFLPNFIISGTVSRWVLLSVFGCVRVFFCGLGGFCGVRHGVWVLLCFPCRLVECNGST